MTGPESAANGTVLQLADERLIWREVEDQVIVLDKRTWQYIKLNGSGTVLWKQLSEGDATPSRLVAHLCDLYEIDEATASRDVEGFVAAITSHGLLRDDEEASADSSAS